MSKNHHSAFWQRIESELKNNTTIALLYVVDSKGSSPGRKGFRMALSLHELWGSIGGGIMEHKWVEYARKKLIDGAYKTELFHQIHSKEAAANQSGMICSGEQTLVLTYLNIDKIDLLNQLNAAIEKDISVSISLSNAGFNLEFDKNKQQYWVNTETDWVYIENQNTVQRLNLIGGGHCALALSEILQKLSFYVCLYDTRKALNTIEQNTFVDEKHIIDDYAQLENLIPPDPNQYTVIMTWGYRTDKIAIHALQYISAAFVGVLGSQHKIDTLKKQLVDEGFAKDFIESLHAPIGLPIHSKTPFEIAISIAAQLIQFRNR